MEKKHKFGEDLVEWLIYFSIILIPLIFLPFLNSIFSFPKLYVLRVVTLIIIVVWMMRFVIAKKTSIHFNKIFWFFIAYAAISIVTTMTSVNIWSSIIGSYGRFVGLVTILNLLLWVYIIYVEVNSKEKVLKFLYCCVITAFFVSIYGILQHQNIWMNGYNWSQDPSLRMFSTIGHSNHLAAYLGMNLMILIGLFMVVKIKLAKIGLGVMGVFIITAMLLTASRGGIIATVVALFLWFSCCLWSKNMRNALKKRGKMILLIIAISIVGVVIFRGPISQLGVVQRTTSTIEFVEQGNIPDRISFWISSWEMIEDKPILGHGVSTFRDVYNQYRRSDYALQGGGQDTVTPHTAHNEFLNIWATQGTIGLLTFILMVGSLFFYARRYMRKHGTGRDKIIIGSVLAAIMLYLLQVFVSFGVIATFFMLTTFAGLIIAYISIDEKSKSIKVPLPAKAIITIIVIIFLGYGALNSLKFLGSEFHYKQAQVFESKRDFQNAVENYERAVELNPYISEYYEKYADLLFNTALQMPDSSQAPYLQDSLELYKKASDLHPNFPYLHANMGLVYSRLALVAKDGNSETYKIDSITNYMNAKDLSRNNPLYLYKYGKTLLFFGSTEEALIQFNDVLKIRDPYKDTQELIDANTQ